MKTYSKYLLTILTSLLFISPAWADTVWIDVRTIEEFEQDHIEGHSNIPLATIEEQGTLSLANKDDEINLYCRSGRRAETAKTVLEAAGFTNVKNLGGIEDVRALSIDAVSE